MYSGSVRQGQALDLCAPVYFTSHDLHDEIQRLVETYRLLDDVVLQGVLAERIRTSIAVAIPRNGWFRN